MIVLHPTTMQQLMTGGVAAQPRLILYTGAMPTVDANFVYTVAAFSAQAVTTVLSVTTNSTAANISFTATPANTNATQTAEITWFALYESSTPANAIIGSVGTQANGTAPLLLTSTSAVSGQPISFNQLSILLS